VALLLIAILLLSPSVAAGQRSQGTIDLSDNAVEQIEHLEMSLAGTLDAPAERQAVMLQWLVELYEFVGDHDGVERSYRRILDFFPSDVGTMNSYARFLFETKNDGERAESLLVAASRWGRSTDARSLDRGFTYELLAQIEMEQGEFDEAIRHAGMAIDLMDDENSAGARRVLAESYRRAGDSEAAVEAYVALIALERGANREDINALKVIVGESGEHAAEDVGEMVESAIRERESVRRDQFDAEGAELVSIESRDGFLLEGTLRRREGTGAILFVPDIGGTRSVYRPYAQLFGIDGFSSLTIDLRGQGGSRSDSLLTHENLPARHFDRLPDDVVAGFRFVQEELDTDGIVIVSEGRACALVEKAIRSGHLAAPVVHLSPTIDAGDRAIGDAIAFHPEGPILMMYSGEDLHALRSVTIYKNTKEFRQLEIRVLHGAGHGVDVLRRDPDALEAVQNWLRNLPPPSDSH